jgi:hypothetical protein
VETFTGLKEIVANPDYLQQRNLAIQQLDIASIDAPIKDIIENIAKLSFCFTLQSCYGHFVHTKQKDIYNFDPLPTTADNIDGVEYRIAYIALCIEPSDQGSAFFRNLGHLPSIDPDYIQFGCADWFWERQVNSFALQVEPLRYQTKDKIFVDFQEALHIEKTRNRFFIEMRDIVKQHIG